MSIETLSAEDNNTVGSKTPDFQKLFDAYKRADKGTRAIIRRAASIGQLLNEPAFYRLVGPLGYEPKQREQWARVVFCLCLPKVCHVLRVLKLRPPQHFLA